eukprot:7373161-Pyramimonas_sp.AAC.1
MARWTPSPRTLEYGSLPRRANSTLLFLHRWRRTTWRKRNRRRTAFGWTTEAGQGKVVEQSRRRTT